MWSFGSVGRDEPFLADLETSDAANNKESEKSLAAAEEKLPDVNHSIQEFYHYKNVMDELVTKVDEAEV